MTGDDDLIFTDTAQEATRKQVPRPERFDSTETGRFGPVNRPGKTAPVRAAPDPEVAKRPHVLISPVLPEPLMLSRTKLYLVGREQGADIRIKTDKVSRAHAEIEWDGKCFVVRDLGSTNGTTLNGRRVGRRRVPLHDNDRITFGGYEIVLNILAPGEFPDMDQAGRTKRIKLPKKR